MSNLNIIIKNATKEQKGDPTSGLLLLDKEGSFSVSIQEIDDFLKKEPKIPTSFTSQVTIEKYQKSSAESRKDYDVAVAKHNKSVDKYEADKKKYKADKKALSEKYKDLNWGWQLVGNKVDPKAMTHNDSFNKGIAGILYNGYTTLKFPKLLEGGGMAWLEVFDAKNPATGSPPRGVFVQAKGTPKVLRTEWTDHVYNIIKVKAAFQSEVLLHVYTQGLYGQELKIELIDQDIFDPNDELLANSTALIREVNVFKLHPNELYKEGISNTLVKSDQSQKDNIIESDQYIQKIEMKVLIDSNWAKTQRDSLKIFVAVKSSKTDVYFEGFERVYLEVGGNGKKFDIPNVDVTNKPLVVGQVETDAANFHPCRFDKATAKYDKGEEKFEIQIYPLLDNNKPKKLTFPIVAGVKQSVQDFFIELEGVKTAECKNKDNKEKDHTGHVIDISKIKHLIKNGRGLPSKKWRAYEYKEVSGIKNENANDENDDQEPDESSFKNTFKFIAGGQEIKIQESYKVLEDYTPFTLEEPTDEKLQLQVGYDYTWNKKVSPLIGLAATIWPNNVAIAQKLPIALHACHPDLPLDIMVYPDTKWTLQLAFNYDAEEFEELREAYHDKWALEEMKAKDNLKNLKKKEEGIPDGGKKKVREKARKEKEKIRKEKNKEKNKQLKARKKKSKISQAKHMFGNITNTGLIDSKLVLMCEFDRPYQAINFTSACDKITNFLHKIGDLKNLVDNIINGKNTETTEHSPTKNKKISGREEKLMAKLDKKKSKSNWSFEFIPPSVGLSLSWYAENPKDLNTPVMGTMIEGAIDLDPLFGFEIKYDVYQLLYKIKHPVVLAVVATLDVLDELAGDNFDINLDLIVTSEISGSLKGTINTAEGSSYKERLMKDEDDTPCKFGGKVGISLKGYMQANGDLRYFVFWKNKVYVEMSAEIKTGISIECVTKADEHSIYVEPEIKFEGLLLEGQINMGFITDDSKTNDIEKLKELDGIHYTAEGKIVVLDPFEWETGWKLPIMTF
jgi:hypothetical protein